MTDSQVKGVSLTELMDTVSQSSRKCNEYEPHEQLNDFHFLFDDEVITIDTVECPRLLKSELHKIFKKTDANLFKSGPITVINILQQESTTFEEVTMEQKMDAKMVYVSILLLFLHFRCLTMKMAVTVF